MPNSLRTLFQITGSLWFAVILLVLLMIAMGCGTVFESRFGREQVMAVFYLSPWFKLLLLLFAWNVFAAMAARWPLDRTHVGFVLTHIGLLFVLGGALVTSTLGIDGQVSIVEGNTVSQFKAAGDSLSARSQGGRSEDSVNLPSSIFGGFNIWENPETDDLVVEGLESLEVLKYVPDMYWEDQVVDDNSSASPAIEVSLGKPGESTPVWLFPGRPSSLGTVGAIFKVVASVEDLRTLIGTDADGKPNSVGTIKLEYQEQTHEIAVEDCREEAIAVADSGLTVRVLNYFPHASVGNSSEIHNVSSNPINPTIQIEVVGGDVTDQRLLFAFYPTLTRMNVDKQIEGLTMTFVSSAPPTPEQPVEILAGPDGGLHARFHWQGTQISGREISLGTSVETPWGEAVFTVHRVFEHAQIHTLPIQPDQPRVSRKPAVLVKMSTKGTSRELWLPRGAPQHVDVEGTGFDFLYGSRISPLGFEITLDHFRLRHYPGGESQRSYESHITIKDSETGTTSKHVVSMNHPVDYGGYTLFQTGYDESGGRTVTFLDLSSDWGVWGAFAGYILTTIGMIIVFSNRVRAVLHAREGVPAGLELEVE